MSDELQLAAPQPGPVPGWLFVTLLGSAVAALIFWQAEEGRGQRQRMSPIISELQAQNHSGLRDENGNTSDWIELWNPTTEVIDLQGWALTDDFRELQKWLFPAVTIEPNGFLVVFATGLDRTNFAASLHTNFRLQPEGEYLALVMPGGTRIAHEFLPKFPRLEPDASFGLRPELFQEQPARLRRDFRDLTFLLEPTPGRPNRDEMLGLVSDTRFSHRRGFYREPFELEITSKPADAEIRYTLDGSLPSRTNGLIYVAPFMVRSDARLRAAAFRPGFKPSNVDTHTYLFPGRWAQPESLADIKDWSDASELAELENRRRIGPGLLALPVMSIVAAERDLARVNGRYYETSATIAGNGAQAVSFEVLFGDPEQNLRTTAGLRDINGGSVLWGKEARRDFRLQFRSDYGEPEFKQRLFGGSGARASRDLIVKSGFGGQSLLSLVEDQWLRQTLLELGRPAVRGQFAHLLVNGSYRGIHLLTERPTEPFLKDLFKNVDVFDVRSEAGLEEGLAATWDRLMTLAADDVSGKTTYGQMTQLLDVPAFIDFILMQLLAGQPGEGDPFSWYAIRPRTGQGKFVFLTGDRSPVPPSPTANVILTDDGSGPWHLFQRLRMNYGFKSEFARRARELFAEGGSLEAAACGDRYEQQAKVLEKALPAEFARWSQMEEAAGWYSAVMFHAQDYFPKRIDTVQQQLVAAGLLMP